MKWSTLPGRHRLTWRTLYAALIGCNVLTVASGLYLGYRVTGIFERSVADDMEWAARLGRFDELNQLAHDVSVPGSDVLESRYTELELDHLNKAVAAFARALADVRADIQSIDNPLVARSLSRSLGQIETDVSQISAESLLIFHYIESNEPEKAATRVAWMDRKETLVHTDFAGLIASARLAQRDVLAEQSSAVNSLGLYEFLVALFVTLTVLAMAVYGHLIAGRMQRADADRTSQHRELERQADALEEARQAAERANRFKTRFFTAIGHDLLQPLHAARLSVSAMAEGDGDTRHARLIGQADHALSTIEELVRTILDLSKLEAGALKPSIETVALDDLFRTLVANLEPIAHSKALTLTARSCDALVSTDSQMLRQILQNLLANAVHYTERGGVLLAARRRGDVMRIEVWDTGPGIAPFEHERIFEEFQRGTASERSQRGGFGIGLSIMRRMAEALGHRIELCSRVGHGTRFSVSAPYAGHAARLPAAASKRAPAQQAYGFAGTKAVVIDNDASVLEAMRPLLDRWSCEARFAQGLAGIETLIAGEPGFRPDIILADYHLDLGDSGLTAVATLRAHWRSEIAAIVITADHSQEVTEHVLAAGCEILRKPVKPAELRALMMHLLG